MLFFFMCDDLPFINTTQKTLKPSKRNVSMPRMVEKKLHTREFQLKGSCGNMRCKLLQKRFGGKTTECSKYLRHIVLKKIFHQNRCIFQISLKYIKLVIPKILFILVLYSFNFYFKIMWPPTPPPPIPITSTHTKIKISNHPSFPPEQRYFWNFYPPSHPLPPSWKEGVHVNVSRYHLRSSTCIFTKNVTLPQVFSNILLVKTNYLVST